MQNTNSTTDSQDQSSKKNGRNLLESLYFLSVHLEKRLNSPKKEICKADNTCSCYWSSTMCYLSNVNKSSCCMFVSFFLFNPQLRYDLINIRLLKHIIIYFPNFINWSYEFNWIKFVFSFMSIFFPPSMRTTFLELFKTFYHGQIHY